MKRVTMAVVLAVFMFACGNVEELEALGSSSQALNVVPSGSITLSTISHAGVTAKIVKVDLDADKVRFRVTSGAAAERYETVTAFANQIGNDAKVVINGGLFPTNGDSCTVKGMWKRNGQLVDGQSDNELNSWIGDKGRNAAGRLMVDIQPWEGNWDNGPATLNDAVAINAILVRNGAKASWNDGTAPEPNSNRERTGVALSPNGRYLYLIATGPMTLNELANLMLNAPVNADIGGNLDGGGSTAMFVRGTGTFFGTRQVCNHIAILNVN
jgi:exopolysaccharide biosynthesis protein